MPRPARIASAGRRILLRFPPTRISPPVALRAPKSVLKSSRCPWPARPPIPRILLDLWEEVTRYPAPPEACLVNYYADAAKMGLHQDKDEEDFAAPVVSVSLGDSAIFRVGGLTRKDETQALELKSGDVVVLGGDDRLAYHGIDRILPGTSALLPEGGRLNLTLRRVTKPV